MTYLGIPLFNTKLKTKDFGSLMDKIDKKNQSLENKFLNISGRIELVKTVIRPLIQFWMHLSQIPVSMIQRINSICADFIWKSKVHKMNWNDVCKCKQEGGLGINKLEDTAKAVAIKLVWKYLQGDTLWAR